MEPKTVSPVAVTYQRPVTTTRVEYVPKVSRPYLAPF